MKIEKSVVMASPPKRILPKVPVIKDLLAQLMSESKYWRCHCKMPKKIKNEKGREINNRERQELFKRAEVGVEVSVLGGVVEHARHARVTRDFITPCETVVCSGHPLTIA